MASAASTVTFGQSSAKERFSSTNLVVGLVTELHAKVEVLDVDIKVGEDKLR